MFSVDARDKGEDGEIKDKAILFRSAEKRFVSRELLTALMFVATENSGRVFIVNARNEGGDESVKKKKSILFTVDYNRFVSRELITALMLVATEEGEVTREGGGCKEARAMQGTVYYS